MENLFDSVAQHPLNALIALAAISLILFILVRIARTVVKLVLTLIVLGLAWYFWQGGTVQGLTDKAVDQIFKETTLTTMESDLCQGPMADKGNCRCIVYPVSQDISSRLSAREMAEFDQDPERVREEIKKSIKNKQKEIRKCLIDEPGQRYLEELKELL